MNALASIFDAKSMQRTALNALLQQFANITLNLAIFNIIQLPLLKNKRHFFEFNCFIMVHEILYFKRCGIMHKNRLSLLFQPMKMGSNLVFGSDTFFLLLLIFGQFYQFHHVTAINAISAIYKVIFGLSQNLTN